MKRHEKMKQTQTDVFLGCPLCNVAPRLAPPKPANTTAPPAEAAANRPPGH
jgi:hypothetical protein